MDRFYKVYRLTLMIVIGVSACLLTLFSYGSNSQQTGGAKTITTLSKAQRANHHLKPKANSIALTFDDGPDPRYTPDILKILDNYNIKATFFVTGEKSKQYPHLLQAIKDHGHSVANHTMTHPKLTRLTQKQLAYQILGTNAIVKKEIGITPVCLRHPFGMYNKRVLTFAYNHDMSVINWDLNSFDYNRKGTKKLTQWVLKESKPGYVILLHDGGGNRSQTVAALPAIIEGFQQRGLGFDPICY